MAIYTCKRNRCFPTRPPPKNFKLASRNLSVASEAARGDAQNRVCARQRWLRPEQIASRSGTWTGTPLGDPRWLLEKIFFSPPSLLIVPFWLSSDAWGHDRLALDSGSQGSRVKVRRVSVQGGRAKGCFLTTVSTRRLKGDKLPGGTWHAGTLTFTIPSVWQYLTQARRNLGGWIA